MWYSPPPKLTRHAVTVQRFSHTIDVRKYPLRYVVLSALRLLLSAIKIVTCIVASASAVKYGICPEAVGTPIRARLRD